MYLQSVTQERRKHARNVPRTPIRITISQIDDSQQYLGMINDVSSSGIGISSPSFFHTGTMLDVDQRPTWQRTAQSEPCCRQGLLVRA